MKIAMVVLYGIAAVLMVVAWRQGPEAWSAGWAGTWRMAKQLLPLLAAAMVVAGFMQAVMPRDLVARWLGDAAGFKGILIAAGAGALTPGGPMVSMPLAAGMVGAGAGIGPAIAYLTGWSMWGVTRLTLEFPIMGPRVTVARIVSTIFVPPLAGWVAQLLFSGWRIHPG